MTNLELKVKALEIALKNTQDKFTVGTIISIQDLKFNERSVIKKHVYREADNIFNYLKENVEKESVLKEKELESKSIPNDVNHPDCIRLINLHGNTFVLRLGENDYSIEITKENRFVYNGVESHSVTVR